MPRYGIMRMSRKAPRRAERQRERVKGVVALVGRITVDPGIHFGKPCIAGTRITVQSVLELLNEGLTFEEIIKDYYPDLQVDDIRACL